MSQVQNSVSLHLMLGFMQSPILIIFSAKFYAPNDCLPLTFSCLVFFSSLLFIIMLVLSEYLQDTSSRFSFFLFFSSRSHSQTKTEAA